MTALQKLTNAFISALEIEPTAVNDSLEYNNNKRWDSTAHMILIAQLEADFDVMFEVDDIIDMSSFTKAKSLLKYYKPELVF